MWGSVSTAPPDYFIVLPQARHGNGWRSTRGDTDLLKTTARRTNTWCTNQAQLMSSALGQQERAVSELMPEVFVLDSFPVRRGDQVRTGDGLEE